MNRTAEITICGAGILGTAAAYFLSKSGLKDIALVDARPPLTLTSDRSTECYRNWWPDPVLLALMNHSIDLMELLAAESRNALRMNRRGYLYVTADEEKIPEMIRRAKYVSGLGGGPLRIHEDGSRAYQPLHPQDYGNQPDGADLLLGPELIQTHFPSLTRLAKAALHVRRAGWLSAQQLGMYLLEAARQKGVRFIEASVDSVSVTPGGGHLVRLGSGDRIESPVFVNAAGPYLGEVGSMLGVKLPVITELHQKAAINDTLDVVDRNSPLLIWEDTQDLPWDPDESRSLDGDRATRWMTGRFPPGVHTRPEGGGDSRTILMLWEYKTRVTPPIWPPELEVEYPEIALRGLAAMLPGMKGYFNRMPKPQVDGGYYTRTVENRPLIGRMDSDQAYLIGAASGYGIMSACGAADLLAKTILREPLPDFAADFELTRYDRPDYLKSVENLHGEGQL